MGCTQPSAHILTGAPTAVCAAPGRRAFLQAPSCMWSTLTPEPAAPGPAPPPMPRVLPATPVHPWGAVL